MKNLVFLFLYLLAQISFAQQLSIEEFATGFSSPLNIQHAGDERLFVVEQGGLIKILNNLSTNPTPYLDISNQISSNGERGLLGLAFHPNYQTNGKFYIYYTDINGDSQLSEFTVDSNNPDAADASSEVNLLSIAQPFSNHNGGCIAFGPDGMLYVATGDGGSAGDPNDNAQNLNSLLGKILRLDVDIAAPYIPSDNPYVNDGNTLDEIWAFGVRNPWKFSFDTSTEEIWIADVGQNEIEEINKTNNTAGLNYGWRCYEGNQVYDSSGNCPENNQLTFPFAEYTHNNSGLSKCSITGGFVYRGSEFPNLLGNYVFADFCSDELGMVDNTGNITYFGPFSGNNFSSFGVDQNNNLYVAGISSGTIYKVIDESLTAKNDSFENLVLYPNPTSGEVFLDAAENIQQVELFSIQGELLVKNSFAHNSSRKLAFSNLASGLYLLKFTNYKEETATKQLIIK
ncbi:MULTISPECIES: PQQ-dependent sugar dehydrogenase [Mesonia]|uniref:Aldose sugar dehydrogenase YliI n=1 Tax=Mesonia oceanica TaxID=2687242 RepID=A0AC61YCP3_9FLAO|nr:MULTISPECIES: PQQ-dependent sugar dehydrogenase [Mesonia]MAN29261.1 cadherin [Mesonia sp.]MAQ39915.1 cadherin [Mesonia sp.]MBJ99049.1 cadherin [Flavobacteriaceae bacterium]VVV02040.1 Aldose sugar dehydrogenase YliI [Mesonia oceanica]|tara:strand:+ start:28827 stop:30194 length:1368 start_codon:yes stop_codon:yes gene_type:complete